MAGERKYTRIPPESTGDRVYMIHTAELRYDNKDVSKNWVVGNRYYLTGGANSNNDFSIHIHGVVEETATSGVLAVHYQATAKHNGYTPEDNQSIREGSVSGDIVATVNGAPYDVYIPAQNIMGWDNPEYGWNIDRFGAGNVRFSEGPAEVTTFGSLRTSQAQLLGQYNFDKSALLTEFANTLVGSGDVQHDAANGYVIESVGTDQDATATHTSNVYHPSLPGYGTLYIIGNKVGDEGQAGVVRNWGCFDSTEGFMFRLDGTTLSVVHRRTFAVDLYPNDDVNGKSEGIIPQSMWNKDRLDGTGPSGMNLNVSKANTYWIDYQNLGGGAIRWGVFYNGERLICHEMDMGNGGPLDIWSSNSLRNPNRPICWSMKRTDSGQGDTETRKQFPLGATVLLEGGTVNLLEEGDLRHYEDDYDFNEDSTWTQGAYYINSIRPKLTIPSIDFTTGTVVSQDNHSLYIPKTLQIWVTDQNNNDVSGELRVFSRCILQEENYRDITYTNLQEDSDGFHVSHGPEIFRHPIKGPTEIDFNKYFSTIQNGSLKVNAEAATASRSQAVLRLENTYSTPSGNRVRLWVGRSPVLGEKKHFFEDKGLITFNDEFAETSIHNQSYYLKLRNGDEALIYANLADLNDDRLVRTLTINSAIGLDVGDDVEFLDGDAIGQTAEVQTASSGTSVRLRARSSATIDVGTTTTLLSFHRNRTISNITGIGTITVTSIKHGFLTGEYTTISGTGNANYDSVTQGGMQITNGSAIITHDASSPASTLLSDFSAGQFIQIGEEYFEISSVDSDSQITLATPVTDEPSGTYTIARAFSITVTGTDTFTYSGTGDAVAATGGTATSHVARTLSSIGTSTSYPKDYYTHILAETGSGWATGTEEITNFDTSNATLQDEILGIGKIKGNPPASPAWTFMWRPITGDPISRGSGETHNLKMSLHWKERLQ